MKRYSHRGGLKVIQFTSFIVNHCTCNEKLHKVKCLVYNILQQLASWPNYDYVDIIQFHISAFPVI